MDFRNLINILKFRAVEQIKNSRDGAQWEKLTLF